jgi:hypothetical protein
MDLTPANQSLASKSISALKWNYLGRLISLWLQFAIGSLFAENPLGENLIQNKPISEQHFQQKTLNPSPAY